MYQFCLESGFLPTHINTILRELQKAMRLEVKIPGTDENVRKGAFYINWQNYSRMEARACFYIKGV